MLSTAPRLFRNSRSHRYRNNIYPSLMTTLHAVAGLLPYPTMGVFSKNHLGSRSQPFCHSWVLEFSQIVTF